MEGGKVEKKRPRKSSTPPVGSSKKQWMTGKTLRRRAARKDASEDFDDDDDSLNVRESVDVYGLVSASCTSDEAYTCLEYAGNCTVISKVRMKLEGLQEMEKLTRE
jgi:hypothetical protein